MYVQLMYRHDSVQRPVRALKILCNYYDVVRGLNDINEALLLRSIPAGWLPCAADRILLTVVNEQEGSTGQRGLRYFLNWGRFFDCYVLELWNSPPH